jgi:prolyl-tRNA synthetase
LRSTAYHAPTLRQAPSEAEAPSHQLLLRGGFIRQLTAGVFTYLPLGLRVLRNVEEIIREEMNRAGAHEVLMPVIHPQELWERSGRWTTFQPEPLKCRDRAGRWYCLAPTHEEAVSDLVAGDITSYRALPLTLYQIQQKFRDELRPRAGLVRGKEFIMKDAYSFDTSREGLDISFDKMYDAYVRIFARLHLDVTIVEAEAGSIGGFGTREFMLPTPSGEDTIIQCDGCDYASNLECASSRSPEPVAPPARSHEPRPVETPGAKTIEAVCTLLGRPPQELVKSLLYHTEEGFVAVLLRGDRQLNENKLARELGGVPMRLAEPEEIRDLTGAEVGYSGPVGLDKKVLVIADDEIAALGDCVVGANCTDQHLVDVTVGLDFVPGRYADLREAAPGDRCCTCEGGTLQAVRGIELGHVFKLGTKYSEALGAVFTDEEGHQQPMIMGCYGIGVSRCVSALVEAHHDEKGMRWPLSVAPFQVAVLLLDPSQAPVAEAAEGLYQDLRDAGYEVLLDDRDERPGVKFKDAELIGFPIVVVVGKKFATEGAVEVRCRNDGSERTVPLAEALAAVQEIAEGL